MKKMGKAHRAFFRICATDKRAPRDGRVLEELGTYDPTVPETDARVRFNAERVAYWLGVGAQPSEKVAVLIKKYGPNGTHLEAQQQALAKLTAPKSVPAAGPAVSKPKQQREAELAAAAAKEAEAKAAEEAKTAEDAKTASEEAAAGAGEGESSATTPAESTQQPAEG
ncbi:MAG TPA: 30S ribosomal protein S16 [Bryobacteraceae bacterium]|nr:30S ribosomal protein S16 [Bryobacteraceae bacterium]